MGGPLPFLAPVLLHGLGHHHPQPGGNATAGEIYHLHIPKVSGISFGLDAFDALSPHGLQVVSREGCYASYSGRPRMQGVAVMLRRPRAHVLSMFRFCRSAMVSPYLSGVHKPGTPALPADFGEWVAAWRAKQAEGWGGSFTPAAPRVSSSISELLVRSYRMKCWEDRPFAAPGEGHLKEADWPNLDGGGTIWHHVHVPFQCYVPVNPQSHRLACSQPMNYSTAADLELEGAVRNVQAAWFVGITERYQESICLLHARAGGALPSYCNCEDPQQWKSFAGRRLNVNGGELEGPHQGVDEYPAEVLRALDELTGLDAQVFQAAWRRFLADVDAAEERHGVKILCDREMPAPKQ